MRPRNGGDARRGAWRGTAAATPLVVSAAAAAASAMRWVAVMRLLLSPKRARVATPRPLRCGVASADQADRDLLHDGAPVRGRAHRDRRLSLALGLAQRLEVAAVDLERQGRRPGAPERRGGAGEAQALALDLHRAGGAALARRTTGSAHAHALLALEARARGARGGERRGRDGGRRSD